MFVQKKFERPSAERRMKKANFDKESMRLTYSIPFKVAKDIRLAIFQFRAFSSVLSEHLSYFTH